MNIVDLAAKKNMFQELVESNADLKGWWMLHLHLPVVQAHDF